MLVAMRLDWCDMMGRVNLVEIEAVRIAAGTAAAPSLRRGYA
jgi:hypothetical protein